MALNFNEVAEVARMQTLITKYENVILSLYGMTKSGNDITMLRTVDSPIESEINALWRWVRERRNVKFAPKKRSDSI